MPAASVAQPFETGIFDPRSFEALDAPTAFAKAREAGATTVRFWTGWSGIAPQGDTKPEGFDPTDPNDPNYAWGLIDQMVTQATDAGLEPILTIVTPPTWARHGPGVGNPDPTELGYFAEAVARRYSGELPGIPRVSRFELWNEPNLYRYILPQWDVPPNEDAPADAKPQSPDIYRRMLNPFSRSIHRVHADNTVIAGGLAPYGRFGKNLHAVHPLTFMRELLCIRVDNTPENGCKPVHFDIWAHHPYTEGGPNHKAAYENNASMGDLPAMRKILDAAIRADHIVSKEKVGFWVTEFSWETNPPDQYGVPEALHARWMAEAFYRMWRQGVSRVVWFKIKDESATSYLGVKHQSGLFTGCEWDCAEPKLAFRAFRFPFVAFRSSRGVRVWGRTPTSTPDDVVIEQRGKSRWRQLGELHADGNGIFKKRLRTRRDGALRARVVGNPEASSAPGGNRSIPFELKETPDMAVTVFGA